MDDIRVIDGVSAFGATSESRKFSGGLFYFQGGKAVLVVFKFGFMLHNLTAA